MFEVNDKVVCVMDCLGRFDRDYPNGRPVKGNLYVVSGVGVVRGTLGLWIVGVPSINVFGKDCGWKACRFRKLSDIQAENKVKRMEKLINSPLPKGNPLKKHFS